MTSEPGEKNELVAEIERLKTQLQEAEETLLAIRNGDVDALVVEGPVGDRVFALEGADRAYRLLVETMNEGALTLETDGTIYYANAHFSKLVNVPLNKVIGTKIQRFIAGEQTSLLENLLQQEGNRRAEFTIALSDRTVPVLVSLSDGDGPSCAIITDLTDQKNVQELQAAQIALMESEARYRTLADAIPQLCWTSTASGKFNYLNQQWTDFTGVPMEKHLGFAWLESIHPDDRQHVLSAWKLAFEQGAKYDLEFRIRGRDRVYRWFKTRAIPVSDSHGTIVKWFGSCTDIEDIVKARQVVAQGREELERLVKERTTQLEETTDQLNSFCHSVAHDLRAPLRAQTSYAQALREDFGHIMGDTGRHYTDRIIASAEKLDRLVEDLLSHVSLSRSDIPLKAVDLSQLIHQMVFDLGDQILEAKATVTTGKIDGLVLANEATLGLILANLISNALKYHKPKTPPKVHIRTEPRPKGYMRTWIEDEGIGIRPEYHEQIFGVFQRLHSNDTYPGTGIGLALVQKGIRRLGGEVGVESALGKGSRFWIDLPLAKENLNGTATMTQL